MKVVIIGCGNVATVFGKLILQQGHEILQVVGRNAEKLSKLASLLKADYTSNLLKINSFADLYIIGVSDLAIAELASQLKLNDRLVVHTAASVSMQVLSTISVNFGVLYPLQSLRKDIDIMPSIPIVIDGSNEQSKRTLINFASEWAHSVVVADDEARSKLHLSAVFANNFTNHLLAICEIYCFTNRLNFNSLRPLIEETFARIVHHLPTEVQTGPAIRNDFNTIESHQKLLQSDRRMADFYNLFTKSIQEFYNNK